MNVRSIMRKHDGMRTGTHLQGDADHDADGDEQDIEVTWFQVDAQQKRVWEEFFSFSVRNLRSGRSHQKVK